MKEKFKKFVSNRKIIIGIYFLFALLASVQSLTMKPKTYEENGIEYNRYNNYTIFEKSFDHLKNNQDLYVLYPDEHFDLYKYTPSFSVFFAVFNILPDEIGLSLWNLMNAFVLLLAVYYLPKLNDYAKGLILLIILLELLTSMQNSQSNGLIAGLIIFTFGYLEREKNLSATFTVVFSAFIKLFGIVTFALFIFYPQKWKAALFTLFWSAILLLLPLIFVDLDQFKFLYKSYLGLLENDHDASLGYSVMGWLNSWFSIDVAKNSIVGIGALIFLVPFIRMKMYKHYLFRYLVLTSILIWIVIFNHKAESPTFIIAMAGVALWFVASEKSKINTALFVLAFVFTSLSPTDLFPKFLREAYVEPYVLKAVPCILIWFKIIYDLLTMKEDNPEVKLSIVTQ